MIDTVASHILALPVWVVLLLVFVVPALESSAFVGFVFPGEVALILGGVLAYEGRLPLVAVLAAGIAGAIIGDSIGYLVGRRYGRGLLEGTLGRFVNHQHFDRAENYLAERGGKAVFFGRFTAALRVMIPGLAGMSRMHYPKFALYNVVGGAAWGTMCVLLGYLGGSSWRHVEHLASRIGLGALAVVVLGFAAGHLLRRTRSGRVRRRLHRIRHSRAANRLTTRFPGATGWTGRRVDPASRTGLPLTFMTAVAVAATWTFLGISQDVGAREELARLDPRVHAWILGHRLGWSTHVFEVVTWLGSNDVLVPLLVAAAVLACRSRRSVRPAAAIAVAYAATLLLHSGVGELVRRHRPPAADWLAGASGWSYPSGHTIQATVAYGVLLVLLTPGRTRRGKLVLTGAYAVIVAAVAASRIYLGMHWFTDVLGSVSLGMALLAVWGIIRLTADRRGLTQRAEGSHGGPAVAGDRGAGRRPTSAASRSTSCLRSASAGGRPRRCG
jgi:membrane protein DedA with SNARE-associated domain/membrane-associated phospholipid phosphatase